LLLGGRQYASKTDDEQITNQVRTYFLGDSPPGFLLKTTDALADSSLDFCRTVQVGNDSETVARICSTFEKSAGLTKW
jgi:hypothetical protein